MFWTKKYLLSLNRVVGLTGLVFSQFIAGLGYAQNLASQSGKASSVDLVSAANDLSMQNAYARALFQFLRANPSLMNDQQFYVNFVSYLISTKLENNCYEAFSNEFERRDFFTRSFQALPQLQQVIADKTIPERFEISYQVITGEYDFATGNLPFSSIRSIGEQLGQSMSSRQGRSCATQMLQGTSVETNTFPWDFKIVNEAGKTETPGFPFANALQVNAADARTLFEQFGRQLYSIVGYQVLAASDGTYRVQVIPTNAQLFGLSDNSVVRARTFAHPTLGQPNYLDVATKLAVKSEPLNLDATVTLEQEGFRAIAKGKGQGRGTGVTAGGTYEVSGSAAVGATSFIMRIAAPQLNRQVPALPNTPGAKRYLTIYGEVDFNNVTASSAPVTGRAVVLQVDPNGKISETNAYPILGRFIATQPPKQAQATAPKASE
ncbi:hypothetical protein HW561_20590 [Rhodobacteraceae bacterium B1Z28]|uniref:Uncharacterized protein n=1 Tax=Ruegeria haliotis TaxID=2747601 RepID=A0ABX2PVI6_9RHOB|nr:hypothetical protein [Ruegeria haliotis]NVO58195.1 hypothetical protein [Ruegeria haliotis]